jgi:tetratricopeptide (TPR) repeat protein
VTAVALALAAACALAMPAAAVPSQKLAMARAEFERGAYERVVEALEPELYPRALIRDEDELKEAHYLLGVSFFYLRQPDRARHEFTALLFLDPARSLDPATESPEVYAFFEGLKGELRLRLEEIRRQKLRDEEAKRQPSREVLVERVIREPSPFSNFAPFGYPQFRNGQPVKGALFLTTQTLGAGTSLALFTYQAAAYGIPSRYTDRADADLLRTLQTVQVAAGAAFLASYMWSVIDGFVNQRPRVEETRSERPLQPTSRLDLVPYLPAAPDAIGASWVWRF